MIRLTIEIVAEHKDMFGPALDEVVDRIGDNYTHATVEQDGCGFNFSTQEIDEGVKK